MNSPSELRRKCVHIHEAMQAQFLLLNTLFLCCFLSIGCFRLFSVGQVVPGTEVKLDSPSPNRDGEICLRGRNVFMGYLHEEAKTKEIFDEEGWLHSGDIGSVDKDGKRETRKYLK